MTALLQIRGLAKRFGGLIATDGVDLDLRAGEIHAVIGPNGAGKTTLVNQITGELRPDGGSIRLEGSDITLLPASERVPRGIVRTFQIPQLLLEASAADNVALALQSRRRAFSTPAALFGRERAAAGEAAALLRRGGLAGRETTRVSRLSHGERKQLELAIALASQPKVLLLDEPMAGLGHTESLEMIDRLAALRGQVAMLLIEHDMDAVFRLADRISVLVYGRVVFCGTAEEVRRDESVRAAYLGDAANA